MQDYQRQLALSLLAYAVQKDVSAERLCGLAGIDFNGLNDYAQPALTARQTADLWLNATHLSNDPQFGLHFGESLQLAALGVVGELIRNSRTIGEALTNAAVFVHLITDAIDIDVKRSDGTFSIQFIPQNRQPDFPLAFRQMMDFFLAFMIHEVDGLVLKRVQPAAVMLPVAETDRAEYERVLRCQAINESDMHVLLFDDRYWDEPILMANYELQGLLLQKVSAMDRAFGAVQKASERIGSYLLANAHLGIPSLETVAANFNTSPRSLQRKLQDEGLTYQQLADSIRKSLAIHFLETGRHPVKEVSYMLGYNELSAFSRAFKRWTGTTPGGYQRGTGFVHEKA